MGVPQNIYRKLDAIVIDEISMVRADLLDCVDRVLRLNGPRADKASSGLQMISIGDLYRLPPVVIGPEKEAFQSYPMSTNESAPTLSWRLVSPPNYPSGK